MSVYTTRLANSRRAMDIYNARNAYYKLLKTYPRLEGKISRITFKISSPPERHFGILTCSIFALICDEGFAYALLDEKRVHVDLKSRIRL